jgi:hypothetical protein
MPTARPLRVSQHPGAGRYGGAARSCCQLPNTAVTPFPASARQAAQAAAVLQCQAMLQQLLTAAQHRRDAIPSPAGLVAASCRAGACGTLFAVAVPPGRAAVQWEMPLSRQQPRTTTPLSRAGARKCPSASRPVMPRCADAATWYRGAHATI